MSPVGWRVNGDSLSHLWFIQSLQSTLHQAAGLLWEEARGNTNNTRRTCTRSELIPGILNIKIQVSYIFYRFSFGAFSIGQWSVNWGERIKTHSIRTVNQQVNCRYLGSLQRAWGSKPSVTWELKYNLFIGIRWILLLTCSHISHLQNQY